METFPGKQMNSNAKMASLPYAPCMHKSI